MYRFDDDDEEEMSDEECYERSRRMSESEIGELLGDLEYEVVDDEEELQRMLEEDEKIPYSERIYVTAHFTTYITIPEETLVLESIPQAYWAEMQEFEIEYMDEHHQFLIWDDETVKKHFPKVHRLIVREIWKTICYEKDRGFQYPRELVGYVPWRWNLHREMYTWGEDSISYYLDLLC